MKALIDTDVLLHECSAVAEATSTGQESKTESFQAQTQVPTIKTFDFVKEIFDGRVSDILAATKSDDYTLYVTGKGNFREEVAVTKPYKGNRKQEKPFHYNNLKSYVLSLPQVKLVEGMEADDAMAIDQDIAWSCDGGDNYSLNPALCETVICTRDKDLRMVPGWHYGWECGYQPEFRLQFVDQLGRITLSKDKKKLSGTGIKFFWSQMLTGDRVDNIPGLEGDGPVAAYDALRDCTSDEECFRVVQGRYEMSHPESWREYMLEQGRLLWMVQELDEEGKPVMWEIPEYGGETVQ